MTRLSKSKPTATAKRKPARRKPKLTLRDLLKLVDRDLPPADQLPENPVLVQRGSVGV
jgi:hypothetical protein